MPSIYEEILLINKNIKWIENMNKDLYRKRNTKDSQQIRWCSILDIIEKYKIN